MFEYTAASRLSLTRPYIDLLVCISVKVDDQADNQYVVGLSLTCCIAYIVKNSRHGTKLRIKVVYALMQ